MKRILSCGAGVQSSTLLLMSCLGELPKLDAAIFADTGWEPPEVYTYLSWLKETSEKHGIPFHVLSGGDIRKDNVSASVFGKGTGQHLPLYTLAPDGTKGMVKRSCTNNYKIIPIRSWIKRELLGLEKAARWPIDPSVEHWFGISFDEIKRTRVSGERWQINAYPLIEDFERPMTRRDCMLWNNARGFPAPGKSACVGCPYRDNAGWREMKLNAPEQWLDAVAFDRSVRHQNRPGYTNYLHPSCVPLDEVDLSTEEERGQGMLFECSGMCGT